MASQHETGSGADDLRSTDEAVVPLEVTQARLDRRAAALEVKSSDAYTIADRVEEQARQYADRPFLFYGNETYTYADMDARANQVARAMAQRGLKAGDVCAVALENRPMFFWSCFGLLKLGVAVAFINNQISGRPLAHALTTTEAKAVIVGDECLGYFEATEGLADITYCRLPEEGERARSAGSVPAWLDDRLQQDIDSAAAGPLASGVRAGLTAGDAGLLVFTSGTTGLPKAAIYSHARWLSAGDVMVETEGATPDDVFYCFLPLYHGAALTSLVSTALKCGGSIVLRRKFSARCFWDDVRHYGVTICQYIGEICRYLLHQDIDPGEHQLRALVGAGLSPEIWRRWVARFGDMAIYEGWGATEAITNLINVDNRIGSCGRVPDWNKTNFRLVRYDVETDTHPRDENGYCMLCGPGEVGEAMGMIIEGMVRFEGYTSRAASESKVMRDVFQAGDAFWQSGDLLRYDEDGYFYFVDRIGDTFRWKSENVSTQEVAAELDGYSGMEMVNIYGVQVPGHEGRAGMAAVVMQPGHSFDPDSFYTLALARLPGYAAPLFVRVAAQTDMTASFKVRKVDLQREGYDPTVIQDPLYVRDDKAGTYRPYSEAVLAEVGLPPFSAS